MPLNVSTYVVLCFEIIAKEFRRLAPGRVFLEEVELFLLGKDLEGVELFLLGKEFATETYTHLITVHSLNCYSILAC
jgi:hypothetical protein